MHLCSTLWLPLKYQIFKMLPKKNRQFIAIPCFCFSQAAAIK